MGCINSGFQVASVLQSADAGLHEAAELGNLLKAATLNIKPHLMSALLGIIWIYVVAVIISVVLEGV